MNRKLTFKGGVHPKDNKNFTSSKPIRELEQSQELIFPLVQHIGAPCVPCVSVGDVVCVGTKIADSEAFVSAPIHSSVSGVVKAIEKRPVPNGNMIDSIIIENDFKNTYDENIKPVDYKTVSPDEIAKIVREAGIVGMGGATFPTHVKLTPPPDKKIDTVIINGTECEPYLTSDHRIMLENPEEIITGLKIMLYRFGISNGHIAIEENKPDAIAVLKTKTANETIKVDVLKKKYPQGGEKQLIYAVTKRKVPVGKLPSDVGVVVINIDTCAAIARRFLYGTPLYRRIVTLVGTPVNDCVNYRVPIGTPIKHIIEKNGELKCETEKIIIGGPMMGVSQFTIDVPIIKGTSAILLLTKDEAKIPEESSCIRCGKCVENCPMNLMPLYLYEFYKKDDIDSCEKYGAASCIECGCCSYGCPAKKNLVQNIRVAKQQVMANMRERAQKQEAK
ncbi:MAG: electron transport complex subunit RsxC [Clostridia bacterium]|nr:electron transport complex subunit RsxC [Clostridia bacterium]